jgi:hypothetical protein
MERGGMMEFSSQLNPILPFDTACRFDADFRGYVRRSEIKIANKIKGDDGW